MQNTESILEIISKEHNYDSNQLNIITSEDRRIIVEAAAGSGKTKVLISSIAYRLITNKLTSTKKILALTFSVNAAYKIKKDVIEKIPYLIKEDKYYDKNISKKIMISNYHGISRRILEYYGQKTLNIKFDLKTAKILSDDELIKDVLLDETKKEIVGKFNSALKDGRFEDYTNYFLKYNQVILELLEKNNILTYNSIISLVIYIFNINMNIKKQYQNLFEYIIVDECQDTNILGFNLLENLINDKTKLLFFGDSIQRIYGFIGALPNVMQLFKDAYSMKRFTLDYNYRFKDNKDLLILDKNIRLNAQNITPTEISNPIILCAESYDLEYKWILDKISELEDDSITILVKSLKGNMNTEYLLSLLDDKHINYFNALFTDESEEYLLFHKKVYSIFLEESFKKMKITKKILDKCYLEVCSFYEESTNKIYKSLIILLRCFIDSIVELSAVYKLEDVIYFMHDVLLNNGLKQYMNRIDEKLIVATVHSFKGLESDVVFVVDLEKGIFPSYYTCKECSNTSNCSCSDVTEKKFLEELSVFYVAITRAKKMLFLSYSKTQKIPKYGQIKCNRSCFLNLPGIGYDNLFMIE